MIILSDIGANTLLLHPDTWLRGKSTPNRLRLLDEWAQSGGGLAMCGSYYSFGGIYGAAHYYGTPVEAILRVRIYFRDDCIEAPEGVIPHVVAPDHPILTGIPAQWPALLGYNELALKPEATLLAKVGERLLLAVQQVGQGRTLAWEGYARQWSQAVAWLAE